MTTSNKPLFVVGDRAITERQFIWILGLFFAILVLVGIRNIALWIVNGTVRKVVNATITNRSVAEVVAPKVEAPLDAKPAPEQKEAPTSTVDSQDSFGNQSPKELLENTSEKRRTLYDFVTPDTIHADVMKQTLNNDYPYQTLKPDPSKIFVPEVAPVQPVKEKTLSTIEFSQVPKQPETAPTSPLPTQPEPVLRAAPTGSINPIVQPPKPQTITPPATPPVTSTPVAVPPQPIVPPTPITPLPVVPETKLPIVQNAPVEQSTPASMPAQPQEHPVAQPQAPIQPPPQVSAPPVVVQTPPTPIPPASELPTIPVVDATGLLTTPPAVVPRKPIDIPPIPETLTPKVVQSESQKPIVPPVQAQVPVQTGVGHPFNPADPLLP